MPLKKRAHVPGARRVSELVHRVDIAVRMYTVYHSCIFSMQNKILRETIYSGVFIALIVFLALPASAHGATLAELRDQIAQLRARIATMQQTQTSAPPSGSIMTPRPMPGQITMDTTFTRNLARGSRGDDVRTLQQFLIAQNLLSPASATGFFGLLTEGAVKNFQALRGIVSSA